MLGRFIERMATSAPLSLWRVVTKRDVLGFYYHVVSDEPLPHIRHLYPYKSARMFENDLKYLVANFNPITYGQLVEHHNRGQRLKPRSAILTFDDGLAECYSVARPLLLRYGIPCTFFITIDYIGNRKMGTDHKASLCVDAVASLEDSVLSDVVESVSDHFDTELSSRLDLIRWTVSVAARDHSAVDYLCQLLDIDVPGYLAKRRPYMSADEILGLVRDGFTIGAHSLGHQEFGSMSDVEVERDIVGSCKAIAPLSGTPQVPFAFPFSADGVSRDMLQELRRRHACVGMFFDTKGIHRDREFMVNRMCADRPEGSAPGRSNLARRMARAYLGDLVARLSHK